MSYQPELILQVKKELDQVSPTFCAAKWMYTSLHLMNGQTNSCCLSPPHRIDASEILTDPTALHNTSEKKRQQSHLLEGIRTPDCQTCWTVEDLPGNQLSDRILSSAEPWARSTFQQIQTSPRSTDITPTYLEVGFSNLCNFKCSYCSPHLSSRWHAEIKQYGEYPLSTPYLNLKHMNKKGMLPIEDEETNPYLKAFWNWWPELYKNLRVFRITGGEPLLSEHTFRVLDWINQHPNPQLELNINSNLGISESVLDRFLRAIEPIIIQKKVLDIRLHTSLDSVGKQAEYIRHGLNFNDFEKNLKKYLETIPQGGLGLVATYNVLSVPRFDQFLNWFSDVRQKYQVNGREIYLDIPRLVGPAHQSIKILTPDFRAATQRHLDQMKMTGAFRGLEIAKMERISRWMNSPESLSDLHRDRVDFFDFFTEHDMRRGTDFVGTFPELRSFWEFCYSLTLQPQTYV